MTKSLDITAFNAIAESEQGFDMELKATDGTGTGVILTVIGRYSDAVQKWSKKVFSDYQQELNLAKRKGKEPPEKSIDELRAQNIEGALVRVIGWKNVKQEFSKDLLKQVLANNPHWVDAIIEESDNAANFTKAL